MSNQSPSRPVLDMQDITMTLANNVHHLGNLVTLLDNIQVNLDLLLNGSELSMPPSKSRNKVILVRNTVQLVRDLADEQTNDLDVYREQLTLSQKYDDMAAAEKSTNGSDQA